MEQQPAQPLITKNFLTHLARGGTKSIPLVGSFIDEMIFGTLDGEKAARQSAAVNEALSNIQSAQGDQGETLTNILSQLNSQANLDAAIKSRLDQLAVFLQNPDATIPADLEGDVTRFLKNHEEKLDGITDRMNTVISQLETRLANISTTPGTEPGPGRAPISRVQLIKKLSRLAPGDMDTLITAVEGASSQVPRNIEVAGQAAALVRWVESDRGPKLPALYSIADELFERFF